MFAEKERPMKEDIEFKINGRPMKIKAEGDGKLLWLIRTDLGLTGTKFGCGEGYCGACTVLLDGKAERACRVPVREIQGKELLTIEGLARGKKLHPLQAAFAERGALQCGFCTPGMILSAHALLSENPAPTFAEIVAAMDGNLCRCGAHPRIVSAIREAGRKMRRGGR